MNVVKNYLDSLNPRERSLVITALLAVALFIPYQFIWKPFTIRHEQLITRVEVQRNQLQTMQNQAQEIRKLRGNNSISAKPGRQFLTNLVNTAARQFGLGTNLDIKQDTQNKLRVKMSNAPFDSIMNWLDRLIFQNGIVINKLTIERQESVGRVNVNVQLEAP